MREVTLLKNELDAQSAFCPQCPKVSRGKRKADVLSAAALPALVDWIQCDACDTYYHWECVRPDTSTDLASVLKWYCDPCLLKASTSSEPLAIEYKRKSGRATRSKDLNYVNLNQGLEADPNRWAKIALTKDIRPHSFPVYPNGEKIGLEWVWSEDSMREPLIFLDSQGLGMRLPPSSTTVRDVADLVGHLTPIEVIDVASQSDLAHWNLGTWAQYYSDPKRQKIRNVISLEVSGTALGDQIEAPRIVREMDWLSNIWPSELRDIGDYPKVSKYCLMSVSKCWTDWHVDFAASSVWYHILRGSKTFYFIKPTPANLAEYEKWSGSSERQENTWLGDKVDAVYEVKLTQGNTMIIPTGWIHAVYTPSDSLVFGGNFLHSLHIPTQLELHRIEIATRVPKKFRFPHFVRFLWLVAKYYQDRLTPILAKGKQKQAMPHDMPRRVLQGLKSLARFLKEQARRLDKHSDASPDQKKAAREALPAAWISDPSTFAGQFRRSVMAALNETEEDQVDEAEEMARLKHAQRRQDSPASSPAKKRKVQPSHKPATTQSETKEVVTTQERRPLPRDDGTFGPEQDVEVQTTTTIQTSETRVKGAGKIIVQKITTTNIQEKIVWLDEEMEETKPILSTDNVAALEDSNNVSVEINVPSLPALGTGNVGLDKQVSSVQPMLSNIPEGLLAFMTAA